jgi:hypothetical protein
MSFTNLITIAIDSILDEVTCNGKCTPTVVELGNQRLKNNKSRAKMYNKLQTISTPATTKEFYKDIGFRKYVAIDVNTEKDAIALDLNMDLSEHYHFVEKFDLVTNNGTGEHIFNQYMVFKNIHNLCQVKGFMIHVLPFYGWVDHGFYNFQPNLFPCLALQNNYKLHALWIGESNGGRIEKLDGKLSRDKGYRHKFALDDWERDPMIVAIMQKKENNEFSSPQQHLYNNDNISDSEIQSRYK